MNDNTNGNGSNTPEPGADGELARVHYLPASRPGGTAEHVGEVLEGEVLTEAEYTARRSQKEQALDRYRGYGQGAVTLYRGARTGVGKRWRFMRRHGTFIVKGAEAERQRRKAERGQADARAARQAALRQGNLEQVAVLNKQIQEARHLRVDTLMKWGELGWTVTKKAVLALLGLLGIAVVLGLANGIGGWFGPWGINDVLTTTGDILTGTWTVVAFGVLYAWAFALVAALVWGFRRWKDGARLGEAVLPEALRHTAGTSMHYVELTEGALSIALGNLGIKGLNDAIKQGWPNRDTDNAWVRFPMMSSNGKGFSAKLRLPFGVPVSKVAAAKETLAHNLSCRPQELFIEADAHDSTVLDLYRLEPGVLREPVPAYPLLESGQGDFFKGYPIGITPRGDEVTGLGFERNYVVSGTMGSGKSTLILNFLGGAALDPIVDIDVFVFATNNDYDWLKPVLNTFGDGDTAENVQACMAHIKGLHADLAVRGELLKKHNVNTVTREAAEKEPGLRPRVVVIDECQSFFRQDSADKRREVVNMCVRFQSAARKYGVILIFATPVPSDQSLPRDLVVVTTNRACGAINDKTRNNVVLGEKAHENGVSALGLKPKTDTDLNDCGTLITVGFMDTPGPVRCYYLTNDQRAQLVERAVTLRGGTTTAARPAVVERDWLADLATVITNKDLGGKVKLTDAASWLRGHAPTYQPYQGLDGKTLAEWLTDAGVTITWPSRQPTATTESIRLAASQREDDTAGE